MRKKRLLAILATGERISGELASELGISSQPIPGFSEDFDYDPIGNRRSSSTYNERGEAQTSTYEANNLNQYTSRTTPGYAAVRGEADPNATVTVNENPTFRLGEYYFGSVVRVIILVSTAVGVRLIQTLIVLAFHDPSFNPISVFGILSYLFAGGYFISTMIESVPSGPLDLLDWRWILGVIMDVVLFALCVGKLKSTCFYVFYCSYVLILLVGFWFALVNLIGALT